MTEFPSFDLSGQTALVTGAARGLGRAISLALAHAGADVALGLRRRAARRTTSSPRSRRWAAGRCRLPWTSPTSTGAGGGRRDGRRISAASTSWSTTPAAARPRTRPRTSARRTSISTVAANLKGTYFTSQAVGRVMIRQKYGRIINLSSQAGHVALPGESVYCMTKAGVSHLTKCLAVEWGKHNITVNAVAPTFFETPGTEEMLSDPEFRADVIERIAGLHRLGKPVEVAGVVVFLASPAASMVTGDTIMIDGGWTAR